MLVKEESKDERELDFESDDNNTGDRNRVGVDHMGSRCGYLLYGIVGASSWITLLGISGDDEDGVRSVRGGVNVIHIVTCFIIFFEFPQIAVNNSNSSEIVVEFSRNIAF